MLVLYIQYNLRLKQLSKLAVNPFRGIPDEARINPNHEVWENFDCLVANSVEELNNKLRSSAYSNFGVTYWNFEVPHGFAKQTKTSPN